MTLFATKDAAPLDAREKALRVKMVHLESELRRLSRETPKPTPQKPKPASPPLRPGETQADFAAPRPPASAAVTALDSSRYNERGIRKFDLVGLWLTMKNHLTSK